MFIDELVTRTLFEHFKKNVIFVILPRHNVISKKSKVLLGYKLNISRIKSQ